MTDYSSLDMSPEELSSILQREEKMKYQPHKLTITKVLNRTAFIKAIDGIFGQLSLAERMKLADNMPYVDDTMMAEESFIESRLKGVCEFSYDLIPQPYCPWTEPEYVAATKWYNNLSDEEKKHVDTLKRANAPYG